MKKEKGFFVIALGDEFFEEKIQKHDYVEDSMNLAQTILKHTKDFPISILCLEKDKERVRESKLFDEIIVWKYDFDLYNNNNLSNHEKNGAIPRIYYNEIVPYKKTICLDTDIICQMNPTSVFQKMECLNQCFVATGQTYNPKWHYGFNKIMSENLGKNTPEIFAALIYINKEHKDSKNFFEKCKEIWNNYDSYKLQKFFRGGKNEEVIFSVCCALFDYKVLDVIESEIMMFNYNSNNSMPAYIQNVPYYDQTQYPICEKIVNTPPPFIHYQKNMRDWYYLAKQKVLNEIHTGTLG